MKDVPLEKRFPFCTLVKSRNEDTQAKYFANNIDPTAAAGSMIEVVTRDLVAKSGMKRILHMGGNTKII